MKKQIFLIFIIIIAVLISFCSCKMKPQSIMNLGNKHESNVFIDGDVTAPVVDTNNKKHIGDTVPFNKKTTAGSTLSYTVTKAEEYDAPMDFNLSKKDIYLADMFYSADGNFLNDKYKLLILNVDIYCTEKEEKANPDEVDDNICVLSNVGTLSENNQIESVTTGELAYFSCNGKAKKPGEKDYYQYNISKGETVKAVCGWMIPQGTNIDELVLQLGSFSYSSDGTSQNDTAYIYLNKGE